jgi:acetoin utilization protein AcuB
MYVKDHMTKNPICISPDTSISKSLDLMAKNHFHRLPVVDENGKLTGLITEGLVSESSGKNQTSLDIFQLNYLLSRTKAKDIMIKDVTTISPDVFLEEAAGAMLKAGISVLPVIDDERRVVGIITEKDIFQAFLDLMGHGRQGTKFIIKCENVPGVLYKLAKCFADEDANLESLAVYHSEERGTEVVIKATGEVSVEEMTEVLAKAGFNSEYVIQTSKEGQVIVWKAPDQA